MFLLSLVNLSKLTLKSIFFFTELHSKVWSWQCKAGSSSTVQGENLSQDGGWRPNRESQNRQESVFLLLLLWYDPSPRDHGPGN